MIETRQVFRIQLIAFVALRLALLMVQPPDALFHLGDFQHYYNLGAWSFGGQCPAGPAPCWPLIDYWYEFPPVFPYLSILILYVVGGGALPSFHSYAYGLAVVLMAADFLTLFLFQRLAQRWLPAGRAELICWVYCLMPAPLILGWWTFDGLTALWMLLALWALVTQRAAVSAASIGLGALTKYVPVLLLPAAWRALAPRKAIGLTLGAAAVFAVGLAPFALSAPRVLAASLQAQASKSSHATVWAMLDGNLQTSGGQPITGNFGPLSDHFDLSRATTPVHNPARVPGWVSLILAGLAFGSVWLLTWRRPRAAWDERSTLLLFCYTWAIFVLWSKGWSPQWQQMLAPLILLAHPNRQGMLIALTLAAVSFLEWPVLLSRGFAWGYWISIPLRTALLAGWAIVLARELLAARELFVPPAPSVS